MRCSSVTLILFELEIWDTLRRTGLQLPKNVSVSWTVTQLSTAELTGLMSVWELSAPRTTRSAPLFLPDSPPQGGHCDTQPNVCSAWVNSNFTPWMSSVSGAALFCLQQRELRCHSLSLSVLHTNPNDGKSFLFILREGLTKIFSCSYHSLPFWANKTQVCTEKIYKTEFLTHACNSLFWLFSY